MQALELLHSEFDIDLLLDINMPRLDGFGVLEVMKQRNWLQEIPVIITSSEDDESFIQKAYELGVTDYIRRPFNLTVTQRRVSNALTLYARQKHLVHLAEEQVYEHEKTNSAIINILSHIVESRNFESGTHILHVRAITDILLRQLVAATNRNLEEAVKEGRFREDLFYRLNVFELEIPPLRERVEDIEPLANDMLLFFANANRKVLSGFSAEALEAMRAYPWPGNLRELRNAVERGAILAPSGVVGLPHLPGALQGRAAENHFSGRRTLAEMEEAYIRHVLATTESLQEAAAILGVNQATLWRKRKSYGI